MAVLSGGGNWITLQKQPIGSVTVGAFVSFEEEVPSSNPAYPPQDILTLEVEGEQKKIGCPTALGRVFKANRIPPGTQLAIKYEGQKKGKRGVAFHSFHVETVEGEDTSFSYGQNAPEPQQDDGVAELEKRLAEARSRRSA